MNSYKQSLFVAIIRIAANVAMIAAVFLSMYLASRCHSLPSEATFCLVFFGITIPVWILAWFLTKKVRVLYPAEFQSLVNLPGKGNQLVRWRVLEPARAFGPVPGRQI